MAIPVSDSGKFADISISEGSVATRVRSGGLYRLTAGAAGERLLEIGQYLVKL